MSESYLLKEQELIKLNEELDLKNKILQNQYKKQHKTECSLKRAENSNKKIASNKENQDGKKFKNLSRCHVEDANIVNSFLEKELPETVDIHKKVISEKTQNDENSNKSTKTPKSTVRSKNSTTSSAAIASTSSTINKVIPDKLTHRNISSEGLIKFLKSKVSILQDELEKCQKDNYKKTEDLQTSFELQKQIEIQRDQVVTRNNTLSAQITKLEEKNNESEVRLKERDCQIISLRRELEGLKRELKNTNQNCLSYEKRLVKTQEDLENAKNNLNSLHDLERETREKTRLDHDMLEKQIKMLRKQRVDLITAYKKQLMLIDNLKRQNLCLEQMKLIDFAEKEFIKILDWNKDEKH